MQSQLERAVNREMTTQTNIFINSAVFKQRHKQLIICMGIDLIIPVAACFG